MYKVYSGIITLGSTGINYTLIFNTWNLIILSNNFDIVIYQLLPGTGRISLKLDNKQQQLTSIIIHARL